MYVDVHGFFFLFFFKINKIIKIKMAAGQKSWEAAPAAKTPEAEGMTS